MNRFFALLLAASCSTAVGQVTYPYNPDSATSVIQDRPEHFPSAFNAQKLESATKAKYIGSGMSLIGLVSLQKGNSNTGIVLSLLGGITAFVGIVVQDIQLVRLGWKHKPRAYNPDRKGSTPVWRSCDEANLVVGDRVVFESSVGAKIEGEIIDMWSSVIDQSCQILVAYEVGGERKTRKLTPTSLTKL